MRRHLHTSPAHRRIKRTTREDDTHQRDNLRVSTVKDEGQECVEEDAHKLDHLQSGQVPGSKKRYLGNYFHFFVDATLFNS